MSRSAAASFSFLLAIPALAGAGALEGLSLLKDGQPLSTPPGYLLIGAAVSFAGRPRGAAIPRHAAPARPAALVRLVLHRACGAATVVNVVWQIAPDFNPRRCSRSRSGSRFTEWPLRASRLSWQPQSSASGGRTSTETPSGRTCPAAGAGSLIRRAVVRCCGERETTLAGRCGGDFQAGGFGGGACEDDARPAAVRPARKSPASGRR